MSNLPTRNGLRLCSHKDPQGEARKWLESLCLQSNHFYVVLGVGAGFHLTELAEQVPPTNFLAFDFDVTLDFSQAAKPWHSRVQVLDRNSDFQDALKTVPFMDSKVIQIVPFRPARNGAEAEFERLHLMLRGVQNFNPNFLDLNQKLGSQLYQALKELVV